MTRCSARTIVLCSMWLGKRSSGSATSAEASGASSLSVTLTSAGSGDAVYASRPGRPWGTRLFEPAPVPLDNLPTRAAMAISQETETTTTDVGQPAARKAERSLVLVAGSGRSGTSLFSGILQRLGYHVPQPEVPADSTNPRGFAESQWVVDFHTRLLMKAGVQVSDARPAAWGATADVALDEAVHGELARWLGKQFRSSDHVLVKDPRLCWFLPLWKRCAEEAGASPRFATLLRHPAAVI